MLDLLRARWRQGTPTASLPAAGRGLPERFRGLPVLESASAAAREANDASALEAPDARALPSSLVAVGEGGRPALDLGACLFSPEEAGAPAAGPVAPTRDYRLPRSTRARHRPPAGR